MPSRTISVFRDRRTFLSIGGMIWGLLFVHIEANGAALPPDSLNSLQKRTINRMAEVRLGNYMNLLRGLATFSDSDEDAILAEEWITDALSGAEPIFSSEETYIESNLDPDPGSRSTVRNRVVKDHLSEYRLMFTPGADEPVEYRILQRGEPRITDGRTHTSIQYEMRFNGQYDPKPGIAYTMQTRVVEFMVVDKGGGNWSVTIASDRSFVPDPAKPFVQYAVDRDLEAVAKGILKATPQLIQLRKAEEDAKKKAEEDQAKKKVDYERAIAEGDKALNEGDLELAIDMYARAQEVDPLSTAHVARRKKAERDLHKKQQEELDRALDQLSLDLARQILDSKIGSVSVPEFSTADGTTTAMGKYLAEQVANRLATNGGFRVLFGDKAAKAKTEVRGRILRTGSANERVNLTATIMNIKREERKGYAQKEFPVPLAFRTGDAVLPPPVKKPVGTWSFGLTAGVNLTRILDTDTLTRAFTVNNKGFRAGADVERISAKGNSRFSTGLRLSQLKCSTDEEARVRVIDVVYLQVPVLFKLFTNQTPLGRFGVQFGGLIDYTVHATTESDVPRTYIEVSNFNLHASPGLCYETKGPGSTHLVANASYDMMSGRLMGGDLPEEGPRLHAISFAVGLRF